LRAEFSEELRAQQAMFLDARAELEARQDEILAQAHAVFEDSQSNSNVKSDEQQKSCEARQMRVD